jgi:hypothetical protein
MGSQQVERQGPADRWVRPACLVTGCPCKDVRIVSRRRAAFFAAWAEEHQETADRQIAPDPEWSPTLQAG